MESRACEEGEFEELKEEVLTYALSEQIPSAPTRGRRGTRNKRERARLHLLRTEDESKPFDLRELGRQARRL